MSDNYIEFRNITKKFAGVTALSDVSLTIRKGECHALMGENGAGKSTLGKVLAGIHRPEGGQMIIDGKELTFSSPADASKAGIGMVHQELAFCPEMSVAENLTLGKMPTVMGLVRDKVMYETAEKLLAQINFSLDVRQPLRNLSTAQEQMVQIAAAIGTGAKILVFDEPTSSLSEREVRQLFALIDDLKSRGVTIIYVSHRMPELFRLSDRISVLRDGKYVGTVNTKEANEGQIVQMMIGRTVEPVSESVPRTPGNVVLKVEHLQSTPRFEDISFEVRAGEIVGLAGLVGAGRSEIAQAVFGLDRWASGSVTVDGKPIRLGDIRHAMKSGVAMVPEDRKRQGLVLMMSCCENCSMAMLPIMSIAGMLKLRKERKTAEDYFQRLSVKAPTIDTPVEGLSGGNQQKVVIAKWLARKAKVLIVDEPTRGVDVGAKAAIHRLIFDLASAGVAVVMISSELPELLRLSDRILVMREGRMVGTMNRAQATQERVLRMMAGVSEGSDAMAVN